MHFSLLDRFVDPDGGMRRHPVAWTLVFCLLEVGEEVVLDRVGAPNEIVGLTGAVSVLFAIIAGGLYGRAVRRRRGACGHGRVLRARDRVRRQGAALGTTLAAGLVWVVSAILAGIVADNLRDEIVERAAAPATPSCDFTSA